MKTYSIVYNKIAGSGHEVYIVKAKDKEEAKSLFLKNTKRHSFIEYAKDSIVHGATIEEITENFKMILDYDDENYEG